MCLKTLKKIICIGNEEVFLWEKQLSYTYITHVKLIKDCWQSKSAGRLNRNMSKIVYSSI